MADASNVPLPLGEPMAASDLSAVVSEADIRRLVDAFYETIRADGVLGPVFEAHVDDWDAHLPKMYDFWSSVVLRTGRYAGRPFVAHAQIPDLAPEQFQHWLGLWDEAVRAVIHADAHFAFNVAAQRMAASMASRLF